MKSLIAVILCCIITGSAYRVSAADVNITTYGAVGDGRTLNTRAIQTAIDACSKTGGGSVIFPAGKFLTGTIVLKDHITLQLQKGAVLLGSTRVEDYENMDPFADGLGIDVGWALVVAVDAKHISITGEGVIDGQGAQLKAQQTLTDTRPESQRWGRRPFLLRIVRCDSVTVTGVTLNYAAAWTSHYFQSRHVRIEKVKIVSYGIAHNDGIDIDGCQQVRIRDCDIESGDDALCFKTTSSTMACKDIVVSGMRLKSNQGAIKMGTESMAPFEDINISDCYIYDTKNGGIKLLTVDGAHLRNVSISDITMENVKTPMLFRLGSRLSVFRKGKDTQQQTGSMENVVVRNVKARAAADAQLMPPSGILITGVPGHYITGLTLENVEIDLAGGGTAAHAHQVVPEAVDKYPEVKTFGPLVPAYGIWARHVKQLKLNNITFRLASNDLRPAFVCEDGKDVEVNNWTIRGTAGAESVIRLENVEGASIKKVSAKGSAKELVIYAAVTTAVKSKWAYIDENGRLAYTKLERGDRIPDFSYAGYMGGGVAIPAAPVKITLSPSPGDNTDAIQHAIDELSKMEMINGSRGALLLKPGVYNCDRTINIQASGVVLRGSGADNTIINMTGRPHLCISVNGAVTVKTKDPSAFIADDYVPSSANTFKLNSAAGFAVGDTIQITRPVTAEWIRFMGMDLLTRDGKPQTWLSGDITIDRVIRKIDGNQVTVDLPLTDNYDAKYLRPPGVAVTGITTAGMLTQSGIEHLSIVAPSQAVTISQEHHRAFSMKGVSDGWARNIGIANTVNSVSISGAKRITLDSINITHDTATIGAAKPADFNGSGSQLLFNRCSVQGDNVFYFATGPKVSGPIVLLNCTFRGKGWIEPHQRWATTLLLDGCNVPDGGIDLMNRGAMGSGHGWAIGWAVAWNCKAKSFLNQQPPGAANWVIGSQGERQKRAIPFNTAPDLPEGIYDAHGTPVAPLSLYLAQLSERLGEQAVKNAGY